MDLPSPSLPTLSFVTAACGDRNSSSSAGLHTHLKLIKSGKVCKDTTPANHLSSLILRIFPWDNPFHGLLCLALCFPHGSTGWIQWAGPTGWALAGGRCPLACHHNQHHCAAQAPSWWKSGCSTSHRDKSCSIQMSPRTIFAWRMFLHSHLCRSQFEMLPALSKPLLHQKKNSQSKLQNK